MSSRGFASAAKAYDVLVIGGGPGGYACAIRAAQLGLRTACVEKRPTLGGTCLNIGCIPSKVLLNASHKYSEVKSFKRMGIDIPEVSLNLPQMMSFKDKTVSTLTRGIDSLFKKNGVERITGTASFKGPHEISIDSKDTISAKNIVIATGSAPTLLPMYNGDTIISSDEAISLDKVPENLVVIGGGIIGLELGSVWQRLGANVTVVEHKQRLLGGADLEIADAFMKIMTKQGLNFQMGRRLKSAASGIATLDSGEELKYSKLLLSIGRKPFTSGLDLEIIGIKPEKSGHIKVNPRNQTTVPSVFAVGDVAPGPMLAHKAEDEGIALAHYLAGDFKFPGPDLELVPSVVYTWPEVAWIGKREEPGLKKGVFPFIANSRARVCGDTDGFVKVVTDANDRIVGAHVIGPNAGELIASLAMAVKYKATALEVADISTAHPTLTEAVKEACLAANFKPIHY